MITPNFADPRGSRAMTAGTGDDRWVEVPQRIQLRRAGGWRMPPDTLKVDRTTRWGNPFRVGKTADLAMARRWGWALDSDEAGRCANAAEAVARFRLRLCRDAAARLHVAMHLHQKNLGCWCALGAPCHGDMLLALANPRLLSDGDAPQASSPAP